MLLGLLPRLVPQRVEPLVYFRTDVGGTYRLVNATNSTGTHISWQSLSDHFTYSQRNWYGGDALAVSHTNSSHVWMSAGAYFEADELSCGIFNSADGGDSWRILSPPGWGVHRQQKQHVSR